MTKEEKINFLISCAEDLEKYYNLEIWGTENLQECADAFRDGAEALREHKKGKWIWSYNNSCYYCSECTSRIRGHIMDVMDGTYAYCPKCGVEMEIDE